MDREKVIKGLECCTRLGCHHGCEYLNSDCVVQLKKDALELLKEQQERIETLEFLRRIEQEGR